jgi:hypothetical protein
MWQGSTLYYLSDATADKDAPHKLNIWSWEPKSGARKQVTRFTDEDVKWPAIGDGEIAYEESGSGHPLLFVSGLNGTGRSWAPQVPFSSRSRLKWHEPLPVAHVSFCQEISALLTRCGSLQAKPKQLGRQLRIQGRLAAFLAFSMTSWSVTSAPPRRLLSSAASMKA